MADVTIDRDSSLIALIVGAILAWLFFKYRQEEASAAANSGGAGNANTPAINPSCVSDCGFCEGTSNLPVAALPITNPVSEPGSRFFGFGSQLQTTPATDPVNVPFVNAVPQLALSSGQPASGAFATAQNDLGFA